MFGSRLQAGVTNRLEVSLKSSSQTTRNRRKSAALETRYKKTLADIWKEGCKTSLWLCSRVKRAAANSCGRFFSKVNVLHLFQPFSFCRHSVFCLKHSSPSFSRFMSRSRNNSLFFPVTFDRYVLTKNPIIACAWLHSYSCSSWSGFSARIRDGRSLKVWVAPDYTLIATLPLASELPLQSASVGLCMCVGHMLCRGGPSTGRTFCCRKVGHAIRSRDQITGLGRCSAQLFQHHQCTSLRCCSGNYGNSCP